MRLLLSIVLGVLAVAGCRGQAPDTGGLPATRAFYWWRTTFQLSPFEEQALTELHVTRLYVRLFDVGWSEGEKQATPLGPLVVKSKVPAGIEVVPVVFVKDEVLKHAPAEALARDVWGEIRRRATALGVTPAELQLDCDWTDKTKTAYFDFLTALRKESKLKLSATIRLHQVKYRERTGVPPVDRGTLMFYNMGKFSADPDARSIFDASTAELYLARMRDYPLPLDVALPIWSWVVHVRDGVVVGLLQSTDPSELDGIDFLSRDDDGRYRATKSTFLHGTFLREGDLLKVEVTGPDETLDAATMIAPRLAPARGSRTVILFDLSERNLARHDPPSLDRVYRSVH